MDDRALDALLDHIPEMVVVINADSTIRYVNRRLLDTMGYVGTEVVGTSIFDYVHPDDHAYMLQTWDNRAANPGTTGILVQARGRNADGTWRAVEVLGLSLLGDGLVDAMVVTMRDLARKAGVGDTPARLRSMVDRTTDVVLLVDREGRIGFANRRLTSRYDIDSDDAVGTRFADLVPDAERGDFERWFAALVAAPDRTEASIRLPVVARGEARRPVVEWHGTNQLDDPLIEGVILSGWDVTELVAMERQLEAQTEQLRHSATHDALTGLLNRPAFVDHVGALLAERRAAHDGGDAVLLFCDLDRFKAVNDSHGHAAGDQVLVVVAQRLRACVRDRDVVARWGGDEFTVLLHGSPPPAVVDELVARIVDRVGAPISVAGDNATVGATVGVSRAPVASADAAELLRAADETMYEHKASRLSHRP